MASTTRVPIASLPLVSPADRLTHNLRPEAAARSVAAFQNETLKDHPSLLRRSRLIPASAHFSFTTPLPLPFPYQIPRGDTDDDRDAGLRSIENWLGQREPLTLFAKAAPLASASIDASELQKLSSDGRNEHLQHRHLLALSQSCLEDCLTALDVGDTFDVVNTPQEAGGGQKSGDQQTKAAREELIDVLSGYATLIASPTDDAGFAPWSLRYCGHQFGIWAGQLGDGRAVSILETPHPSRPEVSYEVQLKGVGRTPFSRSADGLAVMRSSVREFLGAEAVNALGIPTTRSLSLISLPDIPVHRERIETACVVSRVATSFIRVGSFEAHDGPESTVIYLSGPNQAGNKSDWEGLRVLGEWVTRRVLRLERHDDESWGLALVKEAARRNALMVAGWQAFGFMHGVMNTDNISIAGLTIDYGPYAFMDVYNEGHICNHSDDEGRYAYKYQPTMILYAVRALLRSLSVLIGAEEELGHAVPAEWAATADSSKIAEWRAAGQKQSDAVDAELMSVFQDEYYRLMRKRLGLKRSQPTDKKLVQDLLDLLQAHEVDFHTTFRTLSFFRPTALNDAGSQRAFIESLNESVVADKVEASSEAWKVWLPRYAERIQSDESEWTSTEDWLDEREEAMKQANPRFILRQWVLEEVIAKCEKGDLGQSRAVLAKMLEMVTNPFRGWGGEGKSQDALSDTEKEERRLCNLGRRDMLGFQCSCSS